MDNWKRGQGMPRAHAGQLVALWFSDSSSSQREPFG